MERILTIQKNNLRVPYGTEGLSTSYTYFHFLWSKYIEEITGLYPLSSIRIRHFGRKEKKVSQTPSTKPSENEPGRN